MLQNQASAAIAALVLQHAIDHFAVVLQSICNQQPVSRVVVPKHQLHAKLAYYCTNSVVDATVRWPEPLGQVAVGGIHGPNRPLELGDDLFITKRRQEWMRPGVGRHDVALVGGVSVNFGELDDVQANGEESGFTSKAAGQHRSKMGWAIVKRLTELWARVNIVVSSAVPTVKRAHFSGVNVARALAKITFPRVQLGRQVIELDKVHGDVGRVQAWPFLDSSEVREPLGHRQGPIVSGGHLWLEQVERRAD